MTTTPPDLPNEATHTNKDTVVSPLMPYLLALKESGGIFRRHIFVLVNGVILSVVLLLYFFGDVQAALFLGIILFLNTLIGIAQDFEALVSLKRLLLLTRVTSIVIKDDGSEIAVFPEVICAGDSIRVRRGDQVPCDGTITETQMLEVSTALITGESNVFTKNEGENILAGSIVASGEAVILATSSYNESRISEISKQAHVYRASESPIQHAVSRMISFSSVLLVGIIIFVVARAYVVGDPWVMTVRQVGALASVIVPQGLIVVTTLLFAFGASSYSRQHVLFQEINATEKLGRIKNLCMDKTGTLTDNQLFVEQFIGRREHNDDAVKKWVSTYIEASHDNSETMNAVALFNNNQKTTEETLGVLPFSSWRRYGGISIKSHVGTVNCLVGAGDIFLPYLVDDDAAWVSKVLAEFTVTGQRLLCVVESHGDNLPHQLEGTSLTALGVFVFQSGLREGIGAAISFFQKRDIHIRILSGDNIETVRAVAKGAGVSHTELAISGTDMVRWSDEDYAREVSKYHIFARVLPEQKVKIIEALKHDGFTAMVGDGANDALAIRTSDLGIAMFDGAPVTRQLAGVVLMNNSFTALPGAVMLADSFILHLEMFSSIFLNQSILGFYFFVLVSLGGYPFPFTPLNITPINYFAVGMPGILIGYWALRSRHTAPEVHSDSFTKKVLLFPLVSAFVEALGIWAVYLFLIQREGVVPTNTLVGLMFILFGLVFLLFAPMVYRKTMNRQEWYLVCALLAVEAVMLSGGYHVTFLKKLFDIQALPTLSQVVLLVIALIIVTLLQYGVARWFTRYYLRDRM